MNKAQIIQTVKDLELPANSFVVFGSCPMAAADIREAGDVDMLVTREVFEQLRADGWQERDKGGNDKPLTKGDCEAHYAWNFSSYKPTLQQLLETANDYDGIPFASLEEVKKWKQSSGRPKDLEDIKLIDDYLAQNI
jgi:hypothetical protein